MVEVLLDALVAGIVGDAEQEAVVGLDGLSAFFHGEDPAMVRERVDEDGSVLARFDDLVEIADCAAANGLGQGPVDPDGFVGLYKVSADEVAAGEVLVAGDGNQFVGAVFERGELMGHVLDETGFAASGGSFEKDREAGVVGGAEDFDFIADRQVVGGVVWVEVPNLGSFALRPGVEFI